MTAIIRSGTKATIFSNNKTLKEIAVALKVPINVGNPHVGTSVSVPAKKLPILGKILAALEGK